MIIFVEGISLGMHSVPWRDGLDINYLSSVLSASELRLLIAKTTVQSIILNMISNQSRLPAELKHINKRRKRN